MKITARIPDPRQRIQPYRRLVQWGFLLVTLWIGFRFILFVHQAGGTGPITVTRPPGVEAFLPISALISLKYWVLSGIFNTIHPASLVLLLIIIATALFLKKGFCSWVCPFGLFSEYLAKIHTWLFERPRRLPRWLDYPLRSLKYLLLGFFAYAIFFEMDAGALAAFIDTPYNRVADVKMLLFFSHASALTLKVLAALVLLSVLVRFFWCRYLCPYGALLGMLSWLSPLKIHRNESTCIDCNKCNKVCPANIQVATSKTVWSDECHACLQCVDACPVQDTLHLSVGRKKGRMPRWIYAAAIVLIFLLGTSLARILGVWHSSIRAEEYRHRIQHINDSVYNHFGGSTPPNRQNQ